MNPIFKIIQKTKENNFSFLDLSNKELVEIPSAVSELKNISTLNLENNKIQHLPNWLFELRNLRKIHLSNNEIDIIPDKINNFDILSYFYIKGNKLSAIPNSICQLRNLKTLNVHNNLISDLPRNIGDLTSLTELDLSNNQIQTIPISMKNLIGLKRFGFDNNKIAIPPEIAQKGLIRVIDYLINLSTQELIQLFESKLLIVGEGTVGKTSLMKKLINDNHNLMDELPTDGIDINTWKIEIGGEKELFVNIWDFGGQEIYHATHQFFLSKRSLYLLVWEARRSDDLVSFDYWLNVVKLLSDGSPVIVVMNKTDQRIIMIDEKTIKEHFPDIKSFEKISVLDGTGIQDLRKRIKNEILELDHVGEKLPKAWFLVRKELELSTKKIILFSTYETICLEQGLSKKDAHLLSQYYHDLGVFLHFSNNPVLSSIIILKPEWATNAVYKIAENKTVIKNYGEFTYEQLHEILNDYPPESYVYIIELMKKFELCFEMNDKYFIPELMCKELPSFEWNNEDNLILEYKYSFMPKGILTRLIVRCYDLIYTKVYWKNGVLLKYENTEAIVISKSSERKICINVSGNRKSMMLELIKREIFNIHTSQNHPNFIMRIPCICNNCKNSFNPHYFIYEQLEKLFEHKRNVATCPESVEDIKISRLLDRYNPPRYNPLLEREKNTLSNDGKEMHYNIFNYFNGAVNFIEKIRVSNVLNNSELPDDTLVKIYEVLKSMNKAELEILESKVGSIIAEDTPMKKNKIANSINEFMLNHGLPIIHGLTSSMLFDILKILV